MRKFALVHNVDLNFATVTLTNNGKNVCVVGKGFHANSIWSLGFDMKFPKYLDLPDKRVNIPYIGNLSVIDILRAMNVAKDMQMAEYLPQIEAYHSARLNKTLDRLIATRI